MASVWYVHGAGGSFHSFTWLRQQIVPHCTPKFFSYQIDEATETCIERLGQMLAAESDPIILIGHSLGGIIALACAGQNNNIVALVTLCAPFGGIPYANLAALFSNAPMFRDLRQHSSLLTDLRSTQIRAPHLAIVASHGMPHINEANDGVVTLSSQTALAGISYANFPINHFEVLLSPSVSTMISDFLWEIERQ